MTGNGEHRWDGRFDFGPVPPPADPDGTSAGGDTEPADGPWFEGRVGVVALAVDEFCDGVPAVSVLSGDPGPAYRWHREVPVSSLAHPGLAGPRAMRRMGNDTRLPGALWLTEPEVEDIKRNRFMYDFTNVLALLHTGAVDPLTITYRNPPELVVIEGACVAYAEAVLAARQARDGADGGSPRDGSG